MAIQVRWFDDTRTSVYYEFVSKWTWDELYSAVSEGIRLYGGSDRPAVLIVDMQRSQYVPMLTADHLSKVATLSTLTCARNGLLLVGAGHFVRLMFDIFRRIHPVAAERYQFVDSLDDARRQLTAH